MKSEIYLKRHIITSIICYFVKSSNYTTTVGAGAPSLDEQQNTRNWPRGTHMKQPSEVSTALAGWLSWLEHRPVQQRVVGSISSQGTCLGSRCDPRPGCVQEVTNKCFSLTWMFLSLSLPLSKSQ